MTTTHAPTPAAFRPPRLLLPRPGIDLAKWAVVACDQYTSEPAYWQRVAQRVGDAPSTLHLILPEAHLGSPEAAERIGRIQAAMRDCLRNGLLHEHEGPVLVERHLDGRVRRGLMLEIDLEHYDFAADSTSLIRPTEGTIVSRLAPRIEVRRDAELELPHVLVLIDDPAGTVIEALAARRAELAPLYDTELMEGGGRVSGHAVDAAGTRRLVDALARLGEPQAFEQRCRVPPGTPPMLFAVGDGNHSLASAKTIWDRLKDRVAPDHPARHALVEVVNVHDPALVFAPIHRLLLGVRHDLRQALAESFGGRLACTELPSAEALATRVRAIGEAPGIAGGRHVAGLIGPGPRFSLVEVKDPATPLGVATFQDFADGLTQQGGVGEVDYIHGDDVLIRQATAPGCAGLLLPALDKGALFRRVALAGPLPRKAFSMGEAHEKRFYLESRRIRPSAGLG
jgi:hypothetical protein